MSWYFIEPSDVLFFRDSKPFGAGDDHLATSIFPPNPRTVAGAFRSVFLGYSNVDWKAFNKADPTASQVREIIGSPEGIVDSKFSMKGPFLAYKRDSLVSLYTKLPNDSFFSDEKQKRFLCFAPTKDPLFDADWPTDELKGLWPPGGSRKDVPKESYWISENEIAKYRNREAFSGKGENEILQFESRVGIALNLQKRAAKDQHLYQATFIRLQPSYGLVVWLNEEFDTLPGNGHLILGGEAKAARYERLNGELRCKFTMEKPSTKFKVVLMTPAYFRSGFEPENSDWTSILGFPAKLIAASLGKPLSLGGYDVANHKQRAIHTLVAPGSVYYFETEQLIDKLEKPFTESISPEMPLDRLGYGQAFLGDWDWQSLEEEK